MEEKKSERQPTADDLETLPADELPRREAMSIVPLTADPGDWVIPPPPGDDYIPVEGDPGDPSW